MESKFNPLAEDSPSTKQEHDDPIQIKKKSTFTKFYRSAPMKHVMIFVQESSAHNLLLHFAALAEGGVMQFDDLNEDMTAFQRRYAPQIKRCDEMERILGFFETQFGELDVNVPDGQQAAKNFWVRHDAELREYSGVSRNRLIEMERKLLKEEKALRQLNETHEKLNNEFNTCKELKYVLNSSLDFKRDMVAEESNEIFGGNRAAQQVKFHTLIGVIEAGQDKVSFQRMVFRLTRGLAFLKFDAIVDENGDPVYFETMESGKLERVEKFVFTAIFSGQTIRTKIMQVADAFGAHVHDVADEETRGDVRSQLKDVTERLVGLSDIKKKNRAMARNVLSSIAQRYWQWRLTVKLEKTVYHALNKCDVQKAGYMVAQGWLLEDKLETVARIVQTQEGEGNNLVLKSTKKKPPTHFKTNKFTSVFQGMTDTYGVPRYQEANPALFSCVTFPFLFGVMFGDVGHGILLFLGALALVLFEKRLEGKDLGEVPGMLYTGRYMLLCMGIFATYCGLIYNECFCLPLNLFGTIFEKIPATNNQSAVYIIKDDPNHPLYSTAPVYSFGIDPTWHVAENELTFINSYVVFEREAREFLFIVSLSHTNRNAHSNTNTDSVKNHSEMACHRTN